MPSDVRKKLDKALSDYRYAVRSVKDEKAALAKATQEVHDTEQAQTIIQVVAQQVQQQAHDRISAIVSKCLKAVFDDPYEFRIEFDRKRGRTEARLVFVRDGQEVDPLDGAGGGVVDVAAFALQVACIALRRPRRRRLFVADEPFKFVSGRKGFRERVRNLIEVLADELGFQFVLVSHDRFLEVGRVVEVV
jgi:DNA repair exonuclease SbcCD ATPase subunit